MPSIRQIWGIQFQIEHRAYHLPPADLLPELQQEHAQAQDLPQNLEGYGTLEPLLVCLLDKNGQKYEADLQVQCPDHYLQLQCA